MELRSIKWDGRCAEIIDQRELPSKLVFRRLCSLEEFADAIKTMKVRGAPLIGITAAYGVVAHVKAVKPENYDELVREADRAVEILKATRPTAVNLFKALQRVRSAIDPAGMIEENVYRMESTAVEIDREEEEMCRLMGEHGAGVIEKPSARVMTICNTGFLATSGIGTALGVIYTAHEMGKIERVFALETRPVLQGARLTMWELLQRKVPAYLITDNTAAAVMDRIGIDYIFVGADRIAANGDTANKIGTLMLAILAHRFGVPFYVVAPSSTIDPNCPNGREIPIEQRDKNEVIRVMGCQIAPAEADAINFAFDVTPASLITGIITEKGVFRPENIMEAIRDRQLR